MQKKSLFLAKVKEELEVSEDQKALLVLDFFGGQKTEKYLKELEDNNCVHVFVP